MIIRVRMTMHNARQCAGMRQWSTYLRDAVLKRVPGITLEGERVILARVATRITTNVDSTGTTLEFVLESTAEDGRALRSPPLPALLFVMGMLHIAPGHARAGSPMRFACDIGDRKFTDQQWEESYRVLRAMLPPAYYVPYVQDLMDPTAFFQKKA